MTTSQQARANHESSGQAQSNRERILSYVRTFPGQTSAEIAQAVLLERHEAARRLADLLNFGDVQQGTKRACRTNGNAMLTWLPTHRQPAPPQTQTTFF